MRTFFPQQQKSFFQIPIAATRIHVLALASGPDSYIWGPIRVRPPGSADRQLESFSPFEQPHERREMDQSTAQPETESPPSIVQKAWNFAAAIAAFVADGCDTVDRVEYE